ncbi:MAG: hypothetical protein LUQ65_09710 [Candidatus Helarchaeota archaeon]|nr:hypothetical protein [Candidatus Helarchaeota archaeon]
MKTKNFALFLTLFLLVFWSASSMPTLAFSQNPQITDASGDASYDSEDLLKVWLAHNATHLMFKAELAAPFNGTLVRVIYIGISVSDSTGVDTDFFGDWKSDFLFGVSGNGAILRIVLWDQGNSSNSLWDNNQLGYYIQTNNDKTIEIGYRLQTYQEGKGFLNVALGQTIKVRFYSGGDSDNAPENAELPITYTLESGTGSDWLIILLIILIPVIGVALGLFIIFRRRQEL